MFNESIIQKLLEASTLINNASKNGKYIIVPPSIIYIRNSRLEKIKKLLQVNETK